MYDLIRVETIDNAWWSEFLLYRYMNNMFHSMIDS